MTTPVPTTAAPPVPTIGRIVHLLIHPGYNGGSDVCAAVVVKVHHNGMVNVRALRDATPDSLELRHSVMLFATEELARKEAEHRREMGNEPFGAGFLAFWPAR